MSTNDKLREADQYRLYACAQSTGREYFIRYGDKDALMEEAAKMNAIGRDYYVRPPRNAAALAASKPEPQSIDPYLEGIMNRKPEPQAQAAEPETPPAGYCWDTDDMCFRSSFGLLSPPDFHEKWFSKRHEFPTFRERIERGTVFPVEPLCSLKEAIAKRDAALDACVDVLKTAKPYVCWTDEIRQPEDYPEAVEVLDRVQRELNAAITKAQEARKS